MRLHHLCSLPFMCGRSVSRELEAFCKTEARAKLGLGGPMRSCCNPHGTCRVCKPYERRAVNASKLTWPQSSWVPTLAALELSEPAPICAHPFCTGTDRKRFP